MPRYDTFGLNEKMPKERYVETDKGRRKGLQEARHF